MRVRDLMTKPVIFCRPDTNLAQATALMWDNDCGALPVVSKSGRVTGMITDRDICVALGTRNRRASELTVRDVTSGQVRACRPDDEILTALKAMCEGRIRRLPVVNSAGGLEGMMCLDEIVLRAQHCDGAARFPDTIVKMALGDRSEILVLGEHRAQRPPVSYEDVVNTFRGICQRHARHNRRCSMAA